MPKNSSKKKRRHNNSSHKNQNNKRNISGVSEKSFKKPKMSGESSDSDMEDSQMKYRSFVKNPKMNSSTNPDEVKNVLATINSLNTKPEPDTKDVLSAISSLMMLVVSTHSTVTASNYTINSINGELSTLRSDFETFKNSQENATIANKTKINDLTLKVDNNSKEIHYLKQLRVDNDTMISGFPGKPDTKYVDKILNYYKVPLDSVKSKFAFETTHKAGFLSITFHNKSAQLLLRKNKLEIGPLLRNAVLDEPVPEKDNNQLRIFNRLSPENLSIQKELREHKKNEVISTISYKNCFFNVKKKTTDEFTVIYSKKFLDTFVENNQSSTA